MLIFNVSFLFAILFTVMGALMALIYITAGKKRSAVYCLSFCGMMVLSAVSWGVVAGAEDPRFWGLRLLFITISLACVATAMVIAGQGIYHATEP